MQVGEALAALGQLVHEPLEGAALLLAVARPQTAVPTLARLVELDPAEQELQPAGALEPGVALEVEPDVAGRRRRQEGEAAVGLERERVDAVLPGMPVVQLQLRLVAELRKR